MNPRSLLAGAALLALAAMPAIGPAATDSAAKPSAPDGFTIEAIAHVERPRELVATPNGDVIAGTLGSDVYIVSGAESVPGAPTVFARLPDRDAAGVALDARTLYVGTTNAVWKIPYATGDRRARAAAERILAVRVGGDRGHESTSVAVSGHDVYASVGSSCNACEETDATRATIQQMAPDGANARARAVRVRNAIALAVDPATHDLWAGVAGQDELEHGHPYEMFDDVGSHPNVADYGWPTCVENRRAVRPDADCSHVAESRGIFPAYETPIGAVFYPAATHGRYAFPPAWRGGAFVSLHGSWHKPLVAPYVAFVPIAGDAPAKPVDWNDPSAQWRPFLSAWQRASGIRIGRPTGVAVGSEGSLFVADDQTGTIYRIRPSGR